MKKETNRWVVLISSMGILLCTGIVYTFSVFAGPLAELRGWAIPDIMMAFAINSAVGPIPMIFGGYFTDRGWAKWIARIGVLLFGISFAFTGQATSIFQLYLIYGIFGGFAQNFAYSACLSNTIRFFPDKKGLASGLITGGMGGAAIIAAPIANALIERYGVSQAFWRMGLAYALVGFFFSLFIRSAPKQTVPQTVAASEKAPIKAITANKNWKEMLATPAFYLLILMFAMGAFSGLMIASNASLIGQSMFGLSASAAAAYVSLYSLSNTSGRVFWGAVSDRIGQIRAVIIIYSAIIFAFVLLVSVNQVWAFAVGIVTLGLCFGGVMGVFPGLVMDNFGPANQGVNYGIVFIGFSSAAFVAPKVTASLAAANDGDFTKAFYVAIAVVLIGLGLSLVYAKRKADAVEAAVETTQ